MFAWSSAKFYRFNKAWIDESFRVQFKQINQIDATISQVYYLTFIYSSTDWGFTVRFPQLQGQCQGKTHKDGARPELILVIVLLYVFVCCSM
jgi:hypothetical protein